MTYNYLETVSNDVYNAITDGSYFTPEEVAEALQNNRDDFAEKLHDLLWVDDSVTGNASGSYTFNTYEAEENLLHNWDLIEETAEAFGIEPVISSDYKNGPEYWDVSIRCYLLNQAIENALDRLEEELPEETEAE